MLMLLFVADSYSQNVNRKSFYHLIYKTQFPELVHSTPNTNPAYKKRITEIKRKLCSDKLKGVVTMDKGILYFDIWTIDDETDAKKADTSCVSSETVLENSKLLYDINRKKLSNSTLVYKIPFRSNGFGAATIPLRLRFQKNDVPANVSTQLSFAFNYNWMFGKTWFTHRSTTNYAFGLGPFAGVSTADIKKPTSKDPLEYKADRNNAALTTGVNFIFGRNNLGLVIATGIDISMGADSSNWIYQGVPWVGVGVVANLGYF